MTLQSSQNQAAEMNIDNFRSMTSGDLFLKNPISGAKMKLYLTLASPEHFARQKMDFERQRMVREAYDQTGSAPVLSPAEKYDTDTDYLVAATLGWNLPEKGESVVFGPDEARRIYTDPERHWIRLQALDGLYKREVFIVASPSV